MCSKEGRAEAEGPGRRPWQSLKDWAAMVALGMETKKGVPEIF